MTARKPGTRNMDPEQFYKEEAASLASGERSLTRKSNILAGCRLMLFFGIAASVWYTVRTGGGITGILLTTASLILYMAAMKADSRLCKTVMYDVLVSRMFFRWIEKYGRSITGWTSCIAEIDALASLGTYAFNNPGNTYAEVLGDSSETIIEAEALIHPFLAGGTGVPNSFRLGRQNIAIVTGANMAGKSTFLRSIGVNYILAANGAPVCARRFSFVPVSLFSSMRTTDNLAEGTSYFQTELLRLKQMLEHVRTHPYTLVILDEILKGTNSADKLKGSMLVLNELSRQQISGIVATHDLGITELEKSSPDRFTNYCFEIELSGEIRYSYKIRKGVARNMNASYLIEKMLDTIK